MKVCSKCKKSLPNSRFCKNKRNKDKLDGWCKFCQAEYRESSQGKIAQVRFKAKPEKPENKYKQYKKSAKKRGHSFNLTFEQFEYIISRPCVYCDSTEHIGVDRIDNSIGYEFDNCVSSCSKHNLMKGRLTVLEFLIECRKVAEGI